MVPTGEFDYDILCRKTVQLSSRSDRKVGKLFFFDMSNGHAPTVFGSVESFLVKLQKLDVPEQSFQATLHDSVVLYNFFYTLVCTVL